MSGRLGMPQLSTAARVGCGICVAPALLAERRVATALHRLRDRAPQGVASARVPHSERRLPTRARCLPLWRCFLGQLREEAAEDLARRQRPSPGAERQCRLVVVELDRVEGEHEEHRQGNDDSSEAYR